MKEITRAEDTLFSASHPHLYKCFNVSKVVLSSVIALMGVATVILPSVLGVSDTFHMILLVVGIVLLLFGIYRLFWHSQEMVYWPTKSIVRSGTLYMDAAEVQRINRMVEKNDFSALERIACKDGGNGRLDYLVSKDGKFVAIQLFQFVPYNYEPVSEKCYYSNDDVAAVIARCFSF